MANTLRPRRHMTRWLDPLGLAAIAWSMARSRKSERRRDDFQPGTKPTADYRTETGDFWFDYLADLGDAFDPTMAVAWTVGRRSITPVPDSPERSSLPDQGLPRGRFVVLGGDEVYPYATSRRYRNQLTGPYSLAWEPGADPPEPASDLFAIPGNHDWYGNPRAFEDVFLRDKDFGAWRTSQRATWFAIALPHGWWVWAIDTGRKGTINEAQRTYFEAIAKNVGKLDRIILCTPAPLWSLDAKRTAHRDAIDKFIADVLPDASKVCLYLAGDTHVFAAWNQLVDGKKVPHVTSGGGGAFLHPTHHLNTIRDAQSRRNFGLERCWPDDCTSAALAAPWYRLLLDRQSRVLLPGIALLLLWFGHLVWGSFDPDVAKATIEARGLLAPLVSDAGAWVLALLIGAGSFFALSPNSRVPAVRKAAHRFGALLAIAEMTAVLVTGALMGAAVSRAGSGTAGLVVAATCSLLGSVAALATFAIISKRGNKEVSLADNLVFSAAHIEQYKHFLRCRVAENGALTLFAVGLEDPGHGWDALATANGGHPPDLLLSYFWGKTIT